MQTQSYDYLGIDPTDETNLKKARVEYAKVLMPLMREDADTLMVTITGKGLNKKVKIIADSTKEKNIEKIKKAGADVVFSPEVMVEDMMVNEVLNFKP